MNTNDNYIKKQQEEEISDNLKKVFQYYGIENAPENLKNEVFTVKFTQTETELLAGGNSENDLTEF